MQLGIGRNRIKNSSRDWTFAEISQAWIDAKGARFAPSLLGDEVLSRAVEQVSLISVSIEPKTGDYTLKEKLMSFPADVEQTAEPDWLARLIEQVCAQELPATRQLGTQSDVCAEDRYSVTALPLSQDGLFVSSLLLIFTRGAQERRKRLSIVSETAPKGIRQKV